MRKIIAGIDNRILATVDQTLPVIPLSVFEPSETPIESDLQAVALAHLPPIRPDKSVDDTLADFLATPHPIPVEFIQQLGGCAGVLTTIGAEMSKIPLSELIVNKPRPLTPQAIELTAPAQLEKLALVREMIRRTMGIYPTWTQVFTVVTMLSAPSPLKGRACQVNTGEGKSTIIAMMAGFLGILGHRIDIVTSSTTLADRDARKYRVFFANLGLSVSAATHQNIADKDVSGDVVFAINSDFEFIEMARYIHGIHEDARNGTVVIIDEGDNALIDKQGSSARLAISDPGAASRRNLYPLIWTYITKPNQTVAIRPFLETILGPIDDSISDDLLFRLQKSAIEARDQRREGRDYVVRESTKRAAGAKTKEIVIMDHRDTGERQDGCRWQAGIHEFLEVKHGIPVQSESLTVSAMSHPVFFNRYPLRLVITGTAGTDDERTEMKMTYGIDTIDIPPHVPSRRVEYSPIFAVGQKKWLAAILLDVQKHQTDGRPILVVCPSILDVALIANFLSEAGIIANQMTGTQSEDIEFLVTQAGKPQTVTVATFLAGRGMDIRVHQLALAVGGLHVILTVFPDNERTHHQMMGRTARQGQVGSVRLIINQDQLPIAVSSVPELNRLRDLRIQLMTKWRMGQATYDMEVGLYQDRFFKLLVQLRVANPSRVSDLLVQWAMAYTDLNRQSVPLDQLADYFGFLTDWEAGGTEAQQRSF